MSTIPFALCVLAAVVMFWAGVRFIVIRNYVIEVFIGIMLLLASAHVVIILYFNWPPQ